MIKFEPLPFLDPTEMLKALRDKLKAENYLILDKPNLSTDEEAEQYREKIMEAMERLNNERKRKRAYDR